MLAVQASAGAAVSSNLTQAFVGANAKLNQPPTGFDPVASINQSVSVTSGSDTFFQGLAGGAAYNPSAIAIGAVGGAFNVGLLQNTTLASIGTDARVRAKGDVKVQANAAENVLAFSAAVAAGKGTNLFSAEGASATHEGTPTAPAATISVDRDARRVSFVLPAAALGGLPSLAGVKVYVTTWDYDGGYRALAALAAPYSVGGGDPASDPKVMDDSAVILLP